MILHHEHTYNKGKALSLDSTTLPVSVIDHSNIIAFCIGALILVIGISFIFMAYSKASRKGIMASMLTVIIGITMMVANGSSTAITTSALNHASNVSITRIGRKKVGKRIRVKQAEHQQITQVIYIMQGKPHTGTIIIQHGRAGLFSDEGNKGLQAIR